MMRVVRLALAVSAALLPFPLIAASGGGGGSLPSASAPQYDPAAEYRSGVAALQSADYKKAEKHFTRVVGASPRDANSHYLLGMAKAGLDNNKAALRSFAKAVKLDANLIRARQQLGVTYAKLGDATNANAELAELKRRKQSCGGCAQSADIAAAVAAVEAAIGSGPQAARETAPSLLFASAEAGDGRYLDAIALINEGRYEGAIDALRAAQASFGPHPDVLTYLGFAHRKLGRLDAAETYYRQALAAAPEHRGATEYYGELKVERGDLAGAEAMLARLDELCGFGCAEAEELRRWIGDARAGRS
jgi:Flp pilus assembly protein TadD